MPLHACFIHLARQLFERTRVRRVVQDFLPVLLLVLQLFVALDLRVELSELTADALKLGESAVVAGQARLIYSSGHLLELCRTLAYR